MLCIPKLSKYHRYARGISEPAPFLFRHGDEIGDLLFFCLFCPKFKITVIGLSGVYLTCIFYGLSMKINTCERPHGTSWTHCFAFVFVRSAFICVCVCGDSRNLKITPPPKFDPHGWWGLGSTLYIFGKYSDYYPWLAWCMMLLLQIHYRMRSCSLSC